MYTMDQHLHLHQQWELLQHQHPSSSFPSIHIHKVCNILYILHIQGGDHIHNVQDHILHMYTRDQHLHLHQQWELLQHQHPSSSFPSIHIRMAFHNSHICDHIDILDGHILHMHTRGQHQHPH